MLAAVIATKFCMAVPNSNDRLHPMLYSTAFNDGFRQLRADLLSRHYLAATIFMKTNGYIDGKTQTAYDGAVTFIAKHDVANAMHAFYNAQFCDFDTQSSPDVVSSGLSRLLQKAMMDWFLGHVGDSEKQLSSLLRRYPWFGEANIVRGFIAYRSKPKIAYAHWREALKFEEVPPPDAAPQIAAAELLLHFKP